MRSRPSPALIVAILALVASVTGAAVAAPVSNKGVSKSKAKKIANKEIDKRLPLTTNDLSDGSVTTGKLADGAVSTASSLTAPSRRRSWGRSRSVRTR